METAIEIKYCRHCGQLESMRSKLDAKKDENVIEVGCACGAEAPRVTVLKANEPYFLKVETRMEEAESDDDSDSGDISAGGEVGREGDA